MSSTWNGTCALLAEQTATAYAECVMATVHDVHLRLTLLSPDLVIDCYYTDQQFVCEHVDDDALISAVEVMHVTETGRTFSIAIGFKALVDGTTDATFAIISGSADVQNAYVAASGG